MREQMRSSTPVGVSAGAVGGALWWAVGSLALPIGVGTLVLAAGLLLAGSLVVAARRRSPGRQPVSAELRGRIARLVLVGTVLVAAAVVGCRATPYGELAAPVACVVVGGCLMPLAGLLDRRGYLSVGAALMVLGAVGALLALRSAGGLYAQGLVGLGAGALLWLAAAVDARLHLELRTRIGMR